MTDADGDATMLGHVVLVPALEGAGSGCDVRARVRVRVRVRSLRHAANMRTRVPHHVRY